MLLYVGYRKTALPSKTDIANQQPLQSSRSKRGCTQPYWAGREQARAVLQEPLKHLPLNWGPHVLAKCLAGTTLVHLRCPIAMFGLSLKRVHRLTRAETRIGDASFMIASSARRPNAVRDGFCNRLQNLLAKLRIGGSARDGHGAYHSRKSDDCLLSS